MPAKTTETKRADYGSLTPSLADMSNGYKSYAARMENDFRAKYGPNYKKHCPKCKQTRLGKFFGVRLQREPVTGVPKRVIWQSYCTDCRSAPKEGGGKKRTAKTAKKAAARKVTTKVESGEAVVVAPPEAVAPVIPEAAVTEPEAVSEVDPVMDAGMALLAEEGVVAAAPAPVVDDFDTAPSTVEAFQQHLGPALDTLKAETSTEADAEDPVPVETASADPAPAPAVAAPNLRDGEYLTACGEIMPVGSFCSCKTCKTARGQ